MPKDTKKARRDSSSDDSDSGPDDKAPVAKSAKTSGGAKTTSGGGASNCTMENGEPTWLVGGMKFVKVREFKGKKGISLSCEQYQKLKTLIADIDQKLP